METKGFHFNLDVYTAIIINSFGAGTVFRCQNVTSKDTPTPKGFILYILGTYLYVKSYILNNIDGIKNIMTQNTYLE